MPAEPTQLRCDDLLVDASAGGLKKSILIDGIFKLLDFSSGARIVLLNASTQWVPVSVKQYECGHHATHPQSQLPSPVPRLSVTDL
jgi:hypothetical protein